MWQDANAKTRIVNHVCPFIASHQVCPKGVACTDIHLKPGAWDGRRENTRGLHGDMEEMVYVCVVLLLFYIFALFSVFVLSPI